MGVDVGIKVRIYQNNSDEFKEVAVSDQDNSLSTFLGVLKTANEENAKIQIVAEYY